MVVIASIATFDGPACTLLNFICPDLAGRHAARAVFWEHRACAPISHESFLLFTDKVLLVVTKLMRSS